MGSVKKKVQNFSFVKWSLQNINIGESKKWVNHITDLIIIIFLIVLFPFSLNGPFGYH